MPKPKLNVVAQAAQAERPAHLKSTVTTKVATLATVELQGLLTTVQAAEVLNLEPKTLENDRATGQLGVPYVKLGGQAVRYRAADLAAFIDARVVRPARAAA